MPDRDMTYETNCSASDGPSITKMVDAAREITRRTFLEYVDQRNLRDIARSLGYFDHPGWTPTGRRSGPAQLTMAGDWHIRYFKSKYRGKPCVYFVHSAIEYVFTKEHHP